MKFAIIGDRGIPARYSGFSTLTEQIATRLVNEYSFDVTVYCRNGYYPEKDSYYKGVKCVYLPSPGGKSLESIIHSNLSIWHAAIRDYDLALVLDPGNSPFVLPLLLRGMPIIMHTDGMGWKRAKWSPLQKKYYKWSELVTARLSNWLVTDSKAMQEYYLHEYQAPSCYIPYAGEVGDGVDNSILDDLGLEQNTYYLCVARIEPDNNIDVIIREYRASGSDKPLVIVGAARYTTDYGRAIAAENDAHVRCVGGIYDKNRLNALFANSYVYLHGHEVGGTNPSLLNAMHMAAAPVTIDVVFHREVMTDEGLFFSKQPDELAAIIRSLDQDVATVKQLKKLAKTQSDSRFRWDAVTAAYAELATIVFNNYNNKQTLAEFLDKDLYRPNEFYTG